MRCSQMTAELEPERMLEQFQARERDAGATPDKWAVSRRYPVVPATGIELETRNLILTFKIGQNHAAGS